jgi:hypothetical protein
MSRWLSVIALTGAIAAATAFAGWWSVPLVAAIGARVFPHAPVRTAAAAGALGWAGLLGWTASRAPVTLLAYRVGALFHLPPWGFPALTLLFPAVLAALAARAFRPAPFR